MYDFDNTGRGIQDCPKCRHTMTFLSRYNAIERNEGYLLDYGNDNDSLLTLSFLFSGWMSRLAQLIRFLYRQTLQPLYFQTLGRRRQRRHAEIVRAYPYSLICPYCHHIVRQK